MKLELPSLMGAGGCEMINGASVHNFRALRDVTLSDCRRVNIIVGANASGKTALLEALFLASGGSPEIVSRFKAWRGLEQNVGGPLPADYIFRDMFSSFDKTLTIKIDLDVEPAGKRSLRIFYNDQNVVTVPGYNPAVVPQFVPCPVTFQWSDGQNPATEIIPLVGSLGGVQIHKSAPFERENYFFSAGNNYSSQETANRFSALSQAYKHEDVVRIFREEFPDIQDLGVEIFQGVPALAASLKNNRQKFPLSLISGGVNKLATLLCCIQNQDNAVLFVDEIENGFYFQRFQSLWRHIYNLSVKNNAQIFASTHSAECLEAASAIATEHPDDFSVMHMDGNRQLHPMSGKQFVFAVEQNIEIRG